MRGLLSRWKCLAFTSGTNLCTLRRKVQPCGQRRHEEKRQLACGRSILDGKPLQPGFRWPTAEIDFADVMGSGMLPARCFAAPANSHSTLKLMSSSFCGRLPWLSALGVP